MSQHNYILAYAIIELIMIIELKCYHNTEILLSYFVISCYSNSGKNSHFCEDSAISIEINHYNSGSNHSCVANYISTWF